MALSLLKTGIRNSISVLSQMFNDKSETVALKIPMMRCNEFLVKLHDHLIQEEGVPTVAREDDKLDFENRLILLSKTIDENLTQIPAELKAWIDEQKVTIKKFTIVKDISTFSLEQAISKVIKNTNVDSNIRLETLKQFKIVELTAEQQAFKEQIANLILDKSSSGITTILEKKVDQDDNLFFSHSYEYLHGQKNCKLDMQEGNCKFVVDISKVFINNYFQEERDRILNTINVSDTVVDLFGDIILDTRLFKERKAKVFSCVLSKEIKEYFVDTKKLNTHSLRSASRSLSQSVNLGQVETVQGSLEVECKDIFSFLEDHLNKESQNQLFIISKILKDLSFIAAFVGGRQTDKQCTSNGNDGETEKQSVSLFFYYLITEQEYDTKSLQELIIDQINLQIQDISSGSISTSLFQKSDLGSVTQINFDIPNKKLIGVNLKISNLILNHTTPLLQLVREKYTKSISYATHTITLPQDLSEYETNLQKKVKV